MSESIDIRELNARIEQQSAFVTNITAGMSHVIVGQQHLVESLLIGLLSDGHVLLEGVPGLAKTLAISTLSKLVDADFNRIQFTPDLLPADVVGTMIYSQKEERFLVKKGPVFANFVLADEINRTSSKTQAALLEVMEEGKVTVDNETHPVPQPFVVIATENPTGSSGTQMLPESQLDRFMIRISMGYPTMEEEVRLIKERQDINPLDFIQEIISKRELLEMQDQVKQIYVDDKVLTYLSKIVDATRNHSMITLGVSPRGTLALMDMSKAHAFVQGRTFVLPEDIKRVSKAVLAHRLLLNGKARMSHTTEEDVVEEIVGKIQVPKL